MKEITNQPMIAPHTYTVLGMALLVGHQASGQTAGEKQSKRLLVQMPSILRARRRGTMQEIQDFLQEVDLLFNNTRCTICGGLVITHLDCKTMSRCGHVFHTECVELWEFACASKKKPFQCPDCDCVIELFARE
jgi:hypothetical protein